MGPGGKSMIIRTTITMAPRAKERISEAIDATGRTLSVLVTACMQRLMKEHHLHVMLDGRTRYRERGPVPKTWKRQHIGITSRDYEFFIDMRKVCKFSVSLLIDMAIEAHLSWVVRDITKNKGVNADNYPYQQYIIIGEIDGGAVCWRIYWGFPENLRL